MSDIVLVALITAAVTLATSWLSQRATVAVIIERLDELTREVRLHNNFAQRVPTLEVKYENLAKEIEQIKRGG